MKTRIYKEVTIEKEPQDAEEDIKRVIQVWEIFGYHIIEKKNNYIKLAKAVREDDGWW